MDEKTLSEIRERNEKRKDADCEGSCACCWSESESDIDTLLAEVERLNDPLLCQCGFPEEAHNYDEEGWGWIWWPAKFTGEAEILPSKSTTHPVRIMHRAPGDVVETCVHGHRMHPATGDACYAEWLEFAVVRRIGR